MNNTKIKFVYPALDCNADLGFVRLSGAGLGNCLLTYFEAYLFAQKNGATLIHPAWPSIKPGRILRRDPSQRFYAGLMKPGPNEVSGIAKIFALLRFVFRPKERKFLSSTATVESRGSLSVVRSTSYEFRNVLDSRQSIRQRLNEISRAKLLNDGWGNGQYIAAHVRLGDFAVVSTDELCSSHRNNMRIPLSWYASVITQVRESYPSYPVHLFSDGTEAELGPLLDIEGVKIRREASDLQDMVALAGARLLITSRSTFSRWAAFLGDMPAIWFDTATPSEQLSSNPAHHISTGSDTTNLRSRLANLI